METFNVATIKIVYGALFEDEEFPGLKEAVKIIKERRMDYHQLFTYAKAISTNKVEMVSYYPVLCKQMQYVIQERDAVRSPVKLEIR